MEKNNIYLAPGEGHLGCVRQGSSVHATRVEGDFAAHYTPAVDPMLSAAAKAYGDATVAIVLSGMGILNLLFYVLNGNQTNQLEVIVDDRQFFYPMFAEHYLSFFQRRPCLGGD